MFLDKKQIETDIQNAIVAPGASRPTFTPMKGYSPTKGDITITQLQRNKDDLLISITNNTTKPYLIKKGSIGISQIDYEPKNKIIYRGHDLNSILSYALH